MHKIILRRIATDSLIIAVIPTQSIEQAFNFAKMVKEAYAKCFTGNELLVTEIRATNPEASEALYKNHTR